MNKLDVRDIVRDHYATLYDNASGRRRARDTFMMAGLPAAIGVIAVVSGARIYEIGNLLTALAVFAGFLFALLLQLLETAVDASGRPEGDVALERSGRRIRILRELQANVGYSALLSIACTAALGGAELVTKPSQVPTALPAWFCVLVFGLLTHLTLTVLMVLKRTYTLIRSELDRASVRRVQP